MNARKLILSVVAMVAIATTSTLQAQEKKGRGNMSPEQRITQIEEAVGKLSAEQKTKITAIYAKMSEKMQGIPQEERREKMGAIMQDVRKEVRAVLTPEQQKKFDELRQQPMRGKMRRDSGQ